MKRAGFRIALGLLMSALALPTIALSGPPQERAGEVGAGMCADCHYEMAQSMAATIHGRLGAHELDPDRLCEACHGPGSAHADSEGETPIRHRFQGAAAERDVAATCARCHRGGQSLEWPASAHAASGVLCTECHDVKEPYRAAGRAESNALCATCHADQSALFDLPSHHPLREGYVACADCHNPHGAEEMMLRYDNVNDLCFSCHADKAGPFLYEHEPVVEDCLICHSAKGGVNNNLLRMSEATLCLRCHAGHEDTHPRLNSPELRAGYLTRCTRCHGRIHGSDLPGFAGPSRFVR